MSQDARGIDRLKNRARTEVKRAIKIGKLIRPAACERCDSPRGRIEAHHPDYSKPLMVEWLCKGCHHAEHRGEPRAPRTAPTRAPKLRLIHIDVTPSEKQAVRLVCALRGIPESDILRTMTIAKIVAEADRVRAAIQVPA